MPLLLVGNTILIVNINNILHHIKKKKKIAQNFYETQGER